MKPLLLALLCAAPSFADDLLPIEASAVAAPVNKDAQLTLTRAQIEDSESFKSVSREFFNAYLDEIKAGGLVRGVATRRFERLLPHNVAFAQGHMDEMTLAFEERELFGEKRFAQKTSFTYNGKKVSIYRYKEGNGAATSVFIDGEEARGEDGKPLQFVSSSEQFPEFVKWFEGRLGKPKARP